MNAGSRPGPRFESLDSMRGIAALMVVLHHMPRFGPVGFQQAVDVWGPAIDFFYLLSGFVMAHGYRSKLKSGLPIRGFLFTRLGRLWPLHAFILVAFVLMYASEAALLTLLFGVAPEWQKIPGATLSLIQSFALLRFDAFGWNGPSWSIAVEFWIYVIVAFLWSKGGDKSEKWFLPGACLLFMIVGGLSSAGFEIPVAVRLCTNGFLWFAIGVVLWHLNSRLENSTAWGSHGFATRATMAAGVFMTVFALSGTQPYPHLLRLIAFPLLLIGLVRLGGVVAQAFQTKPFAKLGEWAFSIYFVHVLVMETVFRIGAHGRWWNWVQAGSASELTIFVPSLQVWHINAALFVAIIALASLTSRWIEKPTRDWSRGYAKQRNYWREQDAFAKG